MTQEPSYSQADTQTQTQGSQLEWSQNTPVISTVWGRLYPTKNSVKSLVKTLGISRGEPMVLSDTLPDFIDLTSSQFKVGRAEDCDFVITVEMTKNDFWKSMSKHHFVITRDISEPHLPVILHDNSFNGTFINGQKVGKGKKQILESKDEIAIAHPKATFFVFSDLFKNDQGEVPEQISTKYFVSKTLGIGACGVVKLVYNKMTCAKFAMKIITKKRLTNGQNHTLNSPEKIMNEVNILRALKHPSIISTEEVVDTPDMVCIILELMEGGELFDRVSKNGRLTERNSKIIFRQMVFAVKYLHQQGITHRDLKPENVLLANNDSETLVKLTDFGLSKLVGEESFMRTMCGTPLYVAPEVLLAEGKATYGSEVDVWSLGVILFICLSGYLPFSQDYKNMSLREQIIKGKYKFSKKHWEGVSLGARELILRMLIVNPSERISLNDILQHKWMKDEAVIKKVDELMGSSQVTVSIAKEVVTKFVDKNSPAMKRVLSEACKKVDPPPKRRKILNGVILTSSELTNSSDDTIEELSVESLSFK